MKNLKKLKANQKEIRFVGRSFLWHIRIHRRSPEVQKRVFRIQLKQSMVPLTNSYPLWETFKEFISKPESRLFVTWDKEQN